MTGLSAGSLNWRVTLQKIETGQGDLGEPLLGVPVNVATVWASAEMMSNRKIRTLDQQQVVETWHFTIRPFAGVSIDWKVRWQNETYTIVSVDNSFRDRLVIKAERDTRHD